jgi:hypothetical protein
VIINSEILVLVSVRERGAKDYPRLSTEGSVNCSATIKEFERAALQQITSG